MKLFRNNKSRKFSKEGQYMTKNAYDPTGSGLISSALIALSKAFSFLSLTTSNNQADFNDAVNSKLESAILADNPNDFTAKNTFAGETTVRTPLAAGEAVNKSYADSLLETATVDDASTSEGINISSGSGGQSGDINISTGDSTGEVGGEVAGDINIEPGGGYGDAGDVNIKGGGGGYGGNAGHVKISGGLGDTVGNGGNLTLSGGGRGIGGSHDGYLILEKVPVYENEAGAAGAALPTGAMYQTSTGELRIKL